MMQWWRWCKVEIRFWRVRANTSSPVRRDVKQKLGTWVWNINPNIHQTFQISFLGKQRQRNMMIQTSVTESWSLATLFSPPSGVSSTRKGSPSLIKWEWKKNIQDQERSQYFSINIKQYHHLPPSLSADFFFLLLGPAPPSLGLRRTWKVTAPLLA